MKSKVDDKFYPLIVMMFDRLGEISPEITAQYKDDGFRIVIQFITYKSLCKNLPLVFGIKNKLFAKMLFLYVSGRKPLN